MYTISIGIIQMIAGDELEGLLKRLDPARYLFVPGWHGSGPDHWQTLWNDRLPGAWRVEQRDWERPEAGAWTAAIAAEILAARGPVVVVAHSLGCVATALLAQTEPLAAGRIAAALLVAPPDLETRGCPEPLRSFSPVPRTRLPFRSTLVASENDPYMTLESARRTAAAWGSRCVDEGRVGHINTASGHGPWANGVRHLAELVAPLEIEDRVDRCGESRPPGAPIEREAMTL
jgi:uncharacterized protein